MIGREGGQKKLKKNPKQKETTENKETSQKERKKNRGKKTEELPFPT